MQTRIALNKQVAKDLNGTDVVGQLVTLNDDGRALVQPNREAPTRSIPSQVRNTLLTLGYQVETTDEGMLVDVGEGEWEIRPYFDEGPMKGGFLATTPAGIQRWADTEEEAAERAFRQEMIYRANGDLDQVLANCPPIR